MCRLRACWLVALTVQLPLRASSTWTPENAVADVAYQDTNSAGGVVEGVVQWSPPASTVVSGSTIERYTVYLANDVAGQHSAQLWDLNLGDRYIPFGTNHLTIWRTTEFNRLYNAQFPASWLIVHSWHPTLGEQSVETAAKLPLYDASPSVPNSAVIDGVEFADQDGTSGQVGGTVRWTFAAGADLAYTSHLAVYLASDAQGSTEVQVEQDVPRGTNQLVIPQGTAAGGHSYILVYPKNLNGRATSAQWVQFQDDASGGNSGATTIITTTTGVSGNSGTDGPGTTSGQAGTTTMQQVVTTTEPSSPTRITGLTFVDTNDGERQIGGSVVSWTPPDDTSDISRYLVYIAYDAAGTAKAQLWNQDPVTEELASHVPVGTNQMTIFDPTQRRTMSDDLPANWLLAFTWTMAGSEQSVEEAAKIPLYDLSGAVPAKVDLDIVDVGVVRDASWDISGTLTWSVPHGVDLGYTKHFSLYLAHDESGSNDFFLKTVPVTTTELTLAGGLGCSLGGFLGIYARNEMGRAASAEWIALEACVTTTMTTTTTTTATTTTVTSTTTTTSTRTTTTLTTTTRTSTTLTKTTTTVTTITTTSTTITFTTTTSTSSSTSTTTSTATTTTMTVTTSATTTTTITSTTTSTTTTTTTSTITSTTSSTTSTTRTTRTVTTLTISTITISTTTTTTSTTTATTTTSTTTTSTSSTTATTQTNTTTTSTTTTTTTSSTTTTTTSKTTSTTTSTSTTSTTTSTNTTTTSTTVTTTTSTTTTNTTTTTTTTTTSITTTTATTITITTTTSTTTTTTTTVTSTSTNTSTTTETTSTSTTTITATTITNTTTTTTTTTLTTTTTRTTTLTTTTTTTTTTSVTTTTSTTNTTTLTTSTTTTTTSTTSTTSTTTITLTSSTTTTVTSTSSTTTMTTTTLTSSTTTTSTSTTWTTITNTTTSTTSSTTTTTTSSTTVSSTTISSTSTTSTTSSSTSTTNTTTTITSSTTNTTTTTSTSTTTSSTSTSTTKTSTMTSTVSTTITTSMTTSTMTLSTTTCTNTTTITATTSTTITSTTTVTTTTVSTTSSLTTTTTTTSTATSTVTATSTTLSMTTSATTTTTTSSTTTPTTTTATTTTTSTVSTSTTTATATSTSTATTTTTTATTTTTSMTITRTTTGTTVTASTTTTTATTATTTTASTSTISTATVTTTTASTSTATTMTVTRTTVSTTTSTNTTATETTASTTTTSSVTATTATASTTTASTATPTTTTASTTTASTLTATTATASTATASTATPTTTTASTTTASTLTATTATSSTATASTATPTTTTASTTTASTLTATTATASTTTPTTTTASTTTASTATATTMTVSTSTATTSTVSTSTAGTATYSPSDVDFGANGTTGPGPPAGGDHTTIPTSTGEDWTGFVSNGTTTTASGGSATVASGGALCAPFAEGCHERMAEGESCRPECGGNQVPLNNLTCTYDRQGVGHLPGLPTSCTSPDALAAAQTETFLWGMLRMWIETYGHNVTEGDFRRALAAALSVENAALRLVNAVELEVWESRQLTVDGGAAAGELPGWARRLQTNASYVDARLFSLEYLLLPPAGGPSIRELKGRAEAIPLNGTGEQTLFNEALGLRGNMKVITFQDLHPPLVISQRVLASSTGPPTPMDTGFPEVAVTASAVVASGVLLAFTCCGVILVMKCRRMRKEQDGQGVAKKKGRSSVIPTIGDPEVIPEPDSEPPHPPTPQRGFWSKPIGGKTVRFSGVDFVADTGPVVLDELEVHRSPVPVQYVGDLPTAGSRPSQVTQTEDDMPEMTILESWDTPTPHTMKIPEAANIQLVTKDGLGPEVPLVVHTSPAPLCVMLSEPGPAPLARACTEELEGLDLQLREDDGNSQDSMEFARPRESPLLEDAAETLHFVETALDSPSGRFDATEGELPAVHPSAAPETLPPEPPAKREASRGQQSEGTLDLFIAFRSEGRDKHEVNSVDSDEVYAL